MKTKPLLPKTDQLKVGPVTKLIYMRVVKLNFQAIDIAQIIR